VGDTLKITDLRKIMELMYPDFKGEDGDNLWHAHPMTAAGMVLLSAAFLASTDRQKLVTFTRYSWQFISAIAFNMENNRLWFNGTYDDSTWFRSNGDMDRERFWDHVEIACGTLWASESDTGSSIDSCKIYWDERGFL